MTSAIVFVPGHGYLDPSYGLPAGLAPYCAIRHGYEPKAIAGFAVVFAKHHGVYRPVPLSLHIATICSQTECEFRAVPYHDPQAGG